VMGGAFSSKEREKDCDDMKGRMKGSSVKKSEKIKLGLAGGLDRKNGPVYLTQKQPRMGGGGELRGKTANRNKVCWEDGPERKPPWERRGTEVRDLPARQNLQSSSAVGRESDSRSRRKKLGWTERKARRRGIRSNKAAVGKEGTYQNPKKSKPLFKKRISTVKKTDSRKLPLELHHT